MGASRLSSYLKSAHGYREFKDGSHVFHSQLLIDGFSNRVLGLAEVALLACDQVQELSLQDGNLVR